MTSPRASRPRGRCCCELDQRREEHGLWHKYATDEEFNARLFSERLLDPCLTPEGRGRRGVQPRGYPRPNFAHFAKTLVTIAIVFLIGSAAGTACWFIWHQGNNIGNVPGVSVQNQLDGYEWAEIKALSQAIANERNSADGMELAKHYHLVDEDGKLQGDEKSLVLDNGIKTGVRILGFCHDELASGVRAGITFEFVDIPVTHRMNENDSNAGSWEKSEMHSWLNFDFLKQLPEDLRSCIEPASKKTNNAGEIDSEDDTSVVTALADGDKLWLLSLVEVYGSGTGLWSSATYDAEGTQYQLYVDKGVTIENCGFCAKGGEGSWWLRSPNVYQSDRFSCVRANGGKDWGYAIFVRGVSPGFCL